MKQEIVDYLFSLVFDVDEPPDYEDSITPEDAGEIFMIALLMQIRGGLREILQQLYDMEVELKEINEVVKEINEVVSE